MNNKIKQKTQTAVGSSEIVSRRSARTDIIACARKQDHEVGDEAMIAEMEWGYWIGSIYVSKADVTKSAGADAPATKNL